MTWLYFDGQKVKVTTAFVCGGERVYMDTACGVKVHLLVLSVPSMFS